MESGVVLSLLNCGIYFVLGIMVVLMIAYVFLMSQKNNSKTNNYTATRNDENYDSMSSINEEEQNNDPIRRL